MNKYKHILEAVNRGIKFALDDYHDIEDNGLSSKSTVIQNDEIIYNHIEEYKTWFVDLGLPSGTLWMRYNLGANPSKYAIHWTGCYYEMTPNVKHPITNYHMYYKNDKNYIYFNSHYNAKLPTREQCSELLKYCKVLHKDNYLDIQNLNVIKLKSKINDKEIIIPKVGMYNDEDDMLLYDYEGAYFWINSPKGNHFENMFFQNDGHGFGMFETKWGCSLRLVINK